MRLSLFLLALCQLVAFSGSAIGADRDSGALRAVVEQGTRRYQDAFEKRDAQALANLFTPEAEYVDADGTVFHGRAAIQAEYAAHLKVVPPGKLEIEVISIRPIARGTFVEEGISTFHAADDGISTRVHYTATYVQQPDETWLLASVRELNEPVITLHDRLKELSWLLGSWHEDVEGGAVSTEWKWSPDGNFLISEFSISDPERPALSGSQRIGWDAERKQFRSWLFDTSGGALDGWWRANVDGTWSVRLNGVDARGIRISSQLTYAPDGADGLVIVQDQQSRGGLEMPSITRRLVRRPPVPGEKEKSAR